MRITREPFTVYFTKTNYFNNLTYYIIKLTSKTVVTINRDRNFKILFITHNSN